MSNKRTPSGLPLLPNEPARGADIVALLSRVNIGSVVKVFTAIDAVATHLNISRADVVDLLSAPTEAPLFDESDKTRWMSTEELAARIAADPRVQEHKNVLYLSRFASSSAGSRGW